MLRFIEQRINAMIEIWRVEDTDFRIDYLNDWRKRGVCSTVRNATAPA